MIGGVKITEIPLIKAELKNHYKKLKLIQDQRKNYISLDLSLQKLTRSSKSNHNKIFEFKKQSTQKKLAYQNISMFNRLQSIQNRKPTLVFNQLKSLNHGKSFVYRKKQQMAIEATNESIVMRLMNKTGFIDHAKDLQQFNKTRKVVNRLQKFRITQKMMSPQKRSYTLPPKININLQNQENQD